MQVALQWVTVVSESMREVLLVEDNASLAMVFSTHLQNAGIDVQTCHLAEDALDCLAKDDYALVLLDLQLPDRDGLDLLKDIRQCGIETAVIVVTSDASTDRVVDALHVGAQDYLVKPITADRLLVTVRNTLELTSLKQQVSAESGRKSFEGFIGSSRPMQAIYNAIENIAQSKATVFISGESGTGKELCAEAIHRRSPRAEGPFIAINCGAIPKDLIETEMFGHVKGAFTGATSGRDGAASLADGGTLFLDEICEMDIALQTKLLRFLQTGSLQRVGSQSTEVVDVRVICATNRNPIDEVRDGRFREDLYYRLNVIPIYLPPLRERDKDSLLIAEEFVKKISSEEGKHFSEISLDAIDAILSYAWPGNVRELENVIRRVIVFGDGPEIKAEMLPEPVYSGNATAPLVTRGHEPTVSDQSDPIQESEGRESLSWVPEGMILADLEREIIEVAIRRSNGNVAAAAHLLGVSPSTLYRKKAAWDKDEQP